ncbi:MAG: ABC transporter substrate-binding protein, partial [Gammaproteobacteria bacterium]
LAPTSQYQYQWPKWGLYYESGGKSGEAPDMPMAIELLSLNQQWRRAATKSEREKIWHSMLEINREQMFSIGIISGVLRPVVVNNYLNNVPQKGFYDIAPGAYFGIYKPDTFWFDEVRR